MDITPSLNGVKSPSVHALAFTKIKSRPVSWIWPDRIPADCLTIFDGHPGSGKSSVAAAIASHVSGGTRLPELPSPKPRIVSWFTKEEGYAESVIPRLVAAGAKLQRCLIPADNATCESPTRWTLPSALPLFAEWIRSQHVGLLVFDPITSFLDSTISLRDDAAIRSALEPLGELCRKHSCAALMLRHFRKGNGGKAGEQGAGSYAFAAVARMQVGFYSDPDNPTAKHVAWIKTNLGVLPSSLLWHVKVAKGAARVSWQGQSIHSAEQLAEGAGDSAERSASADAEQLLRDELEDGQKLAVDLRKIADGIGITPKQLRRAKERLRVVSLNVWADGGRKWYWKRPKKWPDQ